MNIKNLEQHIIDIRNPSTITLGVKVLNPNGTLTPEQTLQSPEKEHPSLSLTSIGRQQLRNKNKADGRNKGETFIPIPCNVTHSYSLWLFHSYPILLDHLLLGMYMTH